MTFLDLTVDVRSILIRHYWQVTPVFLACKTVVSLQLHMRRGKVLGTRAKKRRVGGRKKKSKRFLSPNPSWSRFSLRFCLLPQSTSKPLLRKLLSSLPARHSRSQLVPKLCRVTPLFKKLLIRSVRFPPRNKEFLVILECKTKNRATLQTRINRPHTIVRYFPYCPFLCYYMYSLVNPASPVILKK